MRMYANELKMIEILEEQQDTLIETLAIYETIEEITGETTLHEQDVLSSKKRMKDIELQILKIKEEGNKRSSEALAVEKRLSASQVSVLDNYRQFNSQFLSLQERRDALINRRVAVNRTLGEKFGLTFEDVLSGKTPGPSMDPEKQIEKFTEYYNKWKEENNHLPNLQTSKQIIERFKKQWEARKNQPKPQTLDARVTSIERKLDKLLIHLGVK